MNKISNLTKWFSEICAERWCKSFRRVWNIAASITLVLVLVYAIILIVGNTRWLDAQIGPSVKECESFWTQHCLINSNTGEKIVPELDWIISPSNRDSIAVYSSGGKRGYVNLNSGQLITAPIYDKAWTFSEGLGAVSLNGTIYFLNPKGEIAIDGVFRQYGDDVHFMNGQCIIRSLDETNVWNCGLIDTYGNWSIPPIYEIINYKPGTEIWYEGYMGARRTDFRVFDDGWRVNHFPDDIIFFGDTIMIEREEKRVYFVKMDTNDWK